MRIKENVAYQLRDANGNLKPLFALNKFGEAVLRFARSHFSQESKGVFKHLALYGLRIPGITGHWTTNMQVSNGVTNAGMAAVAALINGATATDPFDYIAIGTGTTAFNASQTALVTESTNNGAERDQGTASRVTTDVTNDTARVVLTFNFTGSFAITESGLFNDPSAGTMLCRQTFTAINVVSGDSLQVTWDVDVD